MKMTKAQGRRRMMEMESKGKKLFLAGYITNKDLEAIQRIVKARMKVCR
tara:strand:- start:518 stop:664 length:147 start_codon:yes stop_codon:yes gene_type:complete